MCFSLTRCPLGFCAGIRNTNRVKEHKTTRWWGNISLNAVESQLRTNAYWAEEKIPCKNPPLVHFLSSSVNFLSCVCFLLFFFCCFFMKVCMQVRVYIVLTFTHWLMIAIATHVIQHARAPRGSYRLNSSRSFAAHLKSLEVGSPRMIDIRTVQWTHHTLHILPGISSEGMGFFSTGSSKVLNMNTSDTCKYEKKWK